MIITLSIVIIYLISVLGAYKYVQVSHSKGGVWQILTPGRMDISMIFTPGVNIIFAIVYLFGGAKEKSPDYSEFFKVKQ